MVLALPMVIIGQAFEETIREEKTIALERERRLKIMLLDREQKARREMAASESTEEAVERGELEERVSAGCSCPAYQHDDSLAFLFSLYALVHRALTVICLSTADNRHN